MNQLIINKKCIIKAWECTKNELKVNYKLFKCELQMDYENMNECPCEWIPFIMWPCLILALMIGFGILR